MIVLGGGKINISMLLFVFYVMCNIRLLLLYYVILNYDLFFLCCFYEYELILPVVC